jgi:RNA polymerase sigma-70 factor (ECF subfamily)
MSEIEFYNRLLDLEQSLEKFAYSLTQRKTDAKDLVQDTFLKGLLNRDKFVNNENFKAWIFTIMKNTFINDYRRSFRQNTCNGEIEDSFFINQAKSSGSDDPDSAYSFLEMAQIVERLNDKFRIPFKMHFHGYKYKEIADALNLNIGTVKSRIFLSRKQLMSRLNS